MKIVGIDKVQSIGFPGITSRFLELDSEPKDEWKQYFINVCNQNKSSRKRPIRIVDNWVVVECELSELQTQIYEINALLKRADEAYSAWQKQIASEITERERKEEERKKNAEEVFNSLNFD
ncbi:hypothetical protein QNH99_19075 [Pantoea allii]|uniref:hypothetical protein n=1 Tax=Pantoea allii TaxID=574096 RepID=UPI00397744AE